MSASDQWPTSCANPGCYNTVEQAVRSGRRRRYCSDRCGRSYRKRQLPDPGGTSAREYAAQVADECAQILDAVVAHAEGSQPLAALRRLAQLHIDLKDLTSALVEQARSDKKKSSEIASAMRATSDTISRQYSAADNARRRQSRLSRLQNPQAAPLPTRSRTVPHQRTLRAAAGAEQGAAGADDATADSVSTFGRALSHLHRSSDKSMRVLGEEAGVSASYVSRIMSGDRLPTWGVTRRLVRALDASPEDLRPLWDAAHGQKPPSPDSLSAALRGLRLANAHPSFRQLSARINHSLSPGEIAAVIEGDQVPDWEQVEHLVAALHGRPESVLPLWNAAAVTPEARNRSAFSSGLPAGAFG
ncbi:MULTISPECIES: helix-turn-helix transcriptional regulator [unclassified Streptomyces]|uniref:helix-turn-helix domain-containing protein n=1 Tax=unclassified Streptomyces TaxID=2593676 RepID=UPI000C279B18|nr:helix-turn-helix transcriptional regulator [Streptomyces sp. CB01635]